MIFVFPRRTPSRRHDDLNTPQASGQLHSKYDKDASSSFNFIGDRQISLQYGTGSCLGYYARELVTWGGMPLNDQGFLRVFHTTDPFPGAPFDGILGMGFEGLQEPDDNTPPLQTWLAQHDLKTPVFSFEMTDRDGNDLETGKLKIGTMATERYGNQTASIAPVVKLQLKNGKKVYAYWMFHLGGWSVGDSGDQAAGLAMVDSGTSCLVLPPDAWQAFVEKVGGDARKACRKDGPVGGGCWIRVSHGGVLTDR